MFDKKGKRLIDLNEAGVSNGLTKRIILENFHKIEKYESLREALNIYVI